VRYTEAEVVPQARQLKYGIRLRLLPLVALLQHAVIED
jgi:hypothetical protein